MHAGVARGARVLECGARIDVGRRQRHRGENRIFNVIEARPVAVLALHVVIGGIGDLGVAGEARRVAAEDEDHVGGAGLDVYATEPCTDSPLFAFDNVVATPHLGASTAEAQDKAGTAVARSVLLALQGEFVPDAVNVQAGGVVAEEVKPGLPLAEKLGRVS